MSHHRSLDPTLGRKSLVRMSKLITSDLVLLVLLTACNYSGGATPNYDASGIPVARRKGGPWATAGWLIHLSSLERTGR